MRDLKLDRVAVAWVNSLLFVAEVYEKDAVSRPVLGDLQEIDDAFEAALPGQRPGNISQGDRNDGGDNDVTVTHTIATACLHMWPLPDSNGAGNFAASDPLAELFGEDHE